MENSGIENGSETSVRTSGRGGDDSLDTTISNH